MIRAAILAFTSWMLLLGIDTFCCQTASAQNVEVTESGQPDSSPAPPSPPAPSPPAPSPESPSPESPPPESPPPESPAPDSPAPESPSSHDSTSSSPATPVQVLADERFSNEAGRAGLCDVYCPSSAPPTAGYPVVIAVHGGAWVGGDKWNLQGYSRSLAEHGFVAVSINYRLAPTHKFPAQVDDVRAAMLWTKQNAKRFEIDTNRMGIFGYSAGGHLSCLVASAADETIDVRAATSQWDQSDQRWNELPHVRAVCAGGPPCDFRLVPDDSEALSFFLGGSRREKPDVYVAASPASYVSPGDPVTQIIHGESDLIVPIAQGRLFHELQRAAGIDSRFEVMPKQGHIVTFLNPKTNQKVIEFFQETLRQPGSEVADAATLETATQ